MILHQKHKEKMILKIKEPEMESRSLVTANEEIMFVSEGVAQGQFPSQFWPPKTPMKHGINRKSRLLFYN